MYSKVKSFLVIDTTLRFLILDFWQQMTTRLLAAHPFKQNRKNDLILIMTPEKQDKTLELSKHWSVDSTPARNESDNEKDISSKIGKVRQNLQ